MILEPSQLEELKSCITKVNPEKLKERLKHIDDNYISLASEFLLAYNGLRRDSQKLTDISLRQQVSDYLFTFREFGQLFLYLDNYENSFAKTKYRNKIIFLIQGREAELHKFIGFFYKIADVENIMNSTGTGWQWGG